MITILIVLALCAAGFGLFSLVLWTKQKRAAKKPEAWTCHSCGEHHCQCSRKVESNDPDAGPGQ